MNRIISPSILASDFTKLGDEIAMLNESKAEWIHCDVMDGVFVPNISFGIPVIQSIREITEKTLDVHLMIVEPDNLIDSFIKAGANSITVHYEATRHLHRTIQSIKSKNALAGVSLNPHTPVSFLEEIAPELDLVLIMSVNPGYGGQKFIENSLDKISRLKDLLLRRNSQAQIQVDGGVTLDNAQSLYSAGANNLVAGTTIFKSPHPKKTIEELLEV